MITTGEARRAAETWVRGQAPGIPELVGAILTGSTRTRDPEAPHPTGSDVDVFLWVDAEVPSDITQPRGRFAPRKLSFGGVVLEPSFHDARRLADPEAVLGDMHLAPHLADPLVVLDPAGRIAALSAAVGPELRRRRHVERRLRHAAEQVAQMGSRPGVPDVPALRPRSWLNAVLAFTLIRAANVPLVAGLRYPTVRRALVVAREVLAGAGGGELADALLALLGSAALSPADARALVDELWESYDVAAEVRRTPVVMDWNVAREVRALEHAAIGELLDRHHREAMAPVLLLRTVVQGILELDAGGALLARAREGYGRLLAALGLAGEGALLARQAEIQSFLPALRSGCEAILADNPAVLE